MKRKAIKKLAPKIALKQLSAKSIKSMGCSHCGREVMVDIDAIGVLCCICTCKLGGPPVGIKSVEKSDKPKGWAFMSEFVDKDGNVFHKGIEVPKLKGSLPCTNVEKIKKLQKEKSDKKKVSKTESASRKEEKLVNEYKKKQKMKKKLKSGKKVGSLSKFI